MKDIESRTVNFIYDKMDCSAIGEHIEIKFNCYIDLNDREQIYHLLHLKECAVKEIDSVLEKAKDRDEVEKALNAIFK